jgi:lysophospholipase L1-like esterase
MGSARPLRYAIAILFTVLVAFSSRQSHAGPENGVFRVVVLGSSTAAGEAARPIDSSWANKFRDYVGTVFQSYEVINLAVGGFTTFNVMPNGYQRPSPWDMDAFLAVDVNRNITKAIALNPSLILINLPTNDCALGIPQAQQLSNFDVLLDAAGSQGIPVYVSTTQPRNSSSAVRNLLIQMRDAINTRYAGKVLDFWTGLANADGTILALYNYDGTHFNTAGHAILYERARSTVQLLLPVTASPNPLSFGERTVGASTTLSVTVTNASSSSTTFDNIYTGTSHFVTGLTSATLSAGASRDVPVTFTAPGLGAFRDTLYLHNNSSLLVMKVPLSGTAPAPLLQASPASLDFGDVTLQTGKPLTVTLSNADLNNGLISNVTSTTGRFSAAPSSGTINSSSSLNITVTFTPTSYGLVKDTLRFNGAVSGGTFIVPVAGRSPVPVLASSVVSLNFGNVNIGEAKILHFTLFNSTVNPLDLDAIANTNPQFFVEPPSGVIAPNGSLTVTAMFAPSVTGTVVDTIQVVSNATVSPFKIPMGGTGGTFADESKPAEDFPATYALEQNYPNPFNPTTDITFALPRGGHVVLQVLDLLGREIATVADGWQSAGIHRVRFNAEGLSSGIYVYRLRTEEFTATRKMTILK